MIGSEARGQRDNIRLALAAAMVCAILYHIRAFHSEAIVHQDFSMKVASSRPFAPPVHALTLPSKLPMDLRLQFRDLDEINFVSLLAYP